MGATRSQERQRKPKSKLVWGRFGNIRKARTGGFSLKGIGIQEAYSETVAICGHAGQNQLLLPLLALAALIWLACLVEKGYL